MTKELTPYEKKLLLEGQVISLLNCLPLNALHLLQVEYKSKIGYYRDDEDFVYIFEWWDDEDIAGDPWPNYYNCDITIKVSHRGVEYIHDFNSSEKDIVYLGNYPINLKTRKFLWPQYLLDRWDSAYRRYNIYFKQIIEWASHSNSKYFFAATKEASSETVALINKTTGDIINSIFN